MGNKRWNRTAFLGEPFEKSDFFNVCCDRRCHRRPIVRQSTVERRCTSCNILNPALCTANVPQNFSDRRKFFLYPDGIRSGAEGGDETDRVVIGLF